MEEVGSYDSFKLSMELSRAGLIVGPSSGFNLQGLFNFIEKRKAAGTLHELSGDEDGEIHCVFVCCDLPYQYLNEYFTVLGEDMFPPIENHDLVNVDLYRYDEAWELKLDDAIEKFYEELDYDSGLSDTDSHPTPASEKSEDDAVAAARLPSSSTHQLQHGTVLLDLRPAREFAKWSFPGSCNLPLDSFNDDQGGDNRSPFADPKLLERRWKELEKVFSPTSGGTPYSAALVAGLKSCAVVGLVCRDGDTARVASSVLRAKGVQAWSVKGGIEAARR